MGTYYARNKEGVIVTKGDYVLHFHELNSIGSAKELTFTSNGKRINFVTDRFCLTDGKRVFVLVRPSQHPKLDNVYVTEDISMIMPILNSREASLALLEFESYQEAYDYALLYKEINPLCYTK